MSNEAHRAATRERVEGAIIEESLSDKDSRLLLSPTKERKEAESDVVLDVRPPQSKLALAEASKEVFEKE